MQQDPYDPLVRQLFVSPVHAGTLRNSYSLTLTAAVSDRAGATVHLAAGIEGDTVRELRFQALGCPHLIAAAELFCSRFEGRAVATLGDFRPRDLMRELTVPLDKTGRILLLEDAIQLLRQEFSNTTPI